MIFVEVFKYINNLLQTIFSRHVRHKSAELARTVARKSFIHTSAFHSSHVPESVSSRSERTEAAETNKVAAAPDRFLASHLTG